MHSVVGARWCLVCSGPAPGLHPVCPCLPSGFREQERASEWLIGVECELENKLNFISRLLLLLDSCHCTVRGSLF